LAMSDLCILRDVHSNQSTVHDFHMQVLRRPTNQISRNLAAEKE
jgi:hypothetical protein